MVLLAVRVPHRHNGTGPRLSEDSVSAYKFTSRTLYCLQDSSSHVASIVLVRVLLPTCTRTSAVLAPCLLFPTSATPLTSPTLINILRHDREHQTATAEMCYLNWRPEYWEFSPPSPGPRSMPRLDWAVPVDIVSLGASLEAFSNQLQQNTTLRLCHRFGDGPLSMLPQEILDQVIGEAHKVERDTLWSKWESNFMCYQDRCSRFHHLSP